MKLFLIILCVVWVLITLYSFYEMYDGYLENASFKYLNFFQKIMVIHVYIVMFSFIFIILGGFIKFFMILGEWNNKC